MITFKTLSIRNFLSYGNNTSTLDLDFNQPTLIVGKNYDSSAGGQIDSNGAGKSAILNAITYCLYDKTISNIEKNEMVNYINKKNMEVSIVFNTESGYYKIERYRKNKAKGGDGVRLFHNPNTATFDNTNDKTPDSVSKTNLEIEKILGIPFDMFARIVVFSATYEPFLSLPSSHASKANQRDIIEELFGLTELTRKAEILKALITETKQLLRDRQKEDELVLSERTRYINQIAAIDQKIVEWDAMYSSQQEDLNQSLAILSTINVGAIRDVLSRLDKLESEKAKKESEIKLVNVNLNNAIKNNLQIDTFRANKEKRIAELKIELDALSVVDVKGLAKVVENINEYKINLSLEAAKIKNISNEMNILENQKIKISREIEFLLDNKCPYCHQQYHESRDKLEVAKTDLITTEVKIQELGACIVEARQAMAGINDKLLPLMEIHIPNNLKTIEKDILTKKAELDAMIDSETPFTHIDTSTFETKLIILKGELDETNTQIQNSRRDLARYASPSVGYKEWTIQSVDKIASQIQSIQDKLETLAVQVNPFVTVRGELQNMLDSTVDRIDPSITDKLYSDLEHQEFLLKLLTRKDSFVRKALLNRNIPFLNSRLSYYLNSIGLNHSVLFTEEMTAKITHFGTEYSFDNLSSGQKARVNLALLFAFRDVLQARFQRIGFCILDECLDVGLGNVGIQLAAKMIKSIASYDNLSMFVISHRDEVSAIFDRHLQIELRDGFSTINTSTTV